MNDPTTLRPAPWAQPKRDTEASTAPKERIFHVGAEYYDDEVTGTALDVDAHSTLRVIDESAGAYFVAAVFAPGRWYYAVDTEYMSVPDEDVLQGDTRVSDATTDFLKD